MTRRQLDALDFVRETIARSGVSPTLSEIAVHIGLGPKSKGTAHRHVERLVDDGYLIRTGSFKRSLRLPAPSLQSVPTDLLRAELARRGMLR